MLRLTENQLLFLEDAIRKAEIENVIGYSKNESGQPSEEHKEIMMLLDFLRDLRSGQVLVKEDPTTNIRPSLDGDNIDKIVENNIYAFYNHFDSNMHDFQTSKQKKALEMAIKVVKSVKGNETTYKDILDILEPSAGELRKQYINQLEDEYIQRDLKEYDDEFSDDPLEYRYSSHNYQGLFEYLKGLTNINH